MRAGAQRIIAESLLVAALLGTSGPGAALGARDVGRLAQAQQSAPGTVVAWGANDLGVGYGYSLGNRPVDRLRCRIRRRGSPLLLSIVYALVCLLTDLALIRCRDDRTRDVELLALRHEVRVLRRQVKRTAWQPGDRLTLASLSRRLPRAA